jgi:hypothetical protein
LLDLYPSQAAPAFLITAHNLCVPTVLGALAAWRRHDKQKITSEITALDGNFEHEILITRKGLLHIVNLSFDGPWLACLIDLIGPLEDGLLKMCLCFPHFSRYISVSWQC